MRVCSARRFERCERSIGREHDQVKICRVERCTARSPAEVNKIIFAVKVDVAWRGQWFYFLRALIELTLPGLEGDDGGDGHLGRFVM